MRNFTYRHEDVAKEFFRKNHTQAAQSLEYPQIFDGRFIYEPDDRGFASQCELNQKDHSCDCRLRIYGLDVGKTEVIATYDLLSTTRGFFYDTVSQIADTVAREHEIDPNQLVRIEHLSALTGEGSVGETFKRIEFNVSGSSGLFGTLRSVMGTPSELSNPRFNKIEKEPVEALVGMTLPRV